MTGPEDDESNKIDFLEEDLENDQDIESNLDSDSSQENPKNSEEEKLKKVHAELEKQKDLTLRAEAELQNVLKRTAREVENAHKYGLERFIQNLLPVEEPAKTFEATGWPPSIYFWTKEFSKTLDFSFKGSDKVGSRYLGSHLR